MAVATECLARLPFAVEVEWNSAVVFTSSWGYSVPGWFPLRRPHNLNIVSPFSTSSFPLHARASAYDITFSSIAIFCGFQVGSPT